MAATAWPFCGGGKTNLSRTPLAGICVLPRTALHGTDRVCLHWMAPLYRALADSWKVHLCECRARHAKSLVPRVFCGGSAGVLVSSGRGHLEFSLQVGPCRHREGAAGGRTAWRGG